MNAKLVVCIAAVFVIGMMAWHFMRSGPEPSDRRDSGAPPIATEQSHRFASRRSAEPPLDDFAETNNILVRLDRGDLAALTLEQVEGYLRDNHRSAESLIGAFFTTRDKSLLAEAKEKFPNDPRVAFVAATQFDDTPEDHRKWLDAFKQSAPDNALADYLSASEFFHSGRTNQALQDVQAALSKSIRSYQLDFLQNNQEAYRTAGYSEVEARTTASMHLLLPEMAHYKNVGTTLVNLAKSYQEAGDAASAQSLLGLAMDIGRRVDDPNSLTIIQKLVGLAIQRTALNAMDPNAVLGPDNRTVQNQLDAIKQDRLHISSLVKEYNSFKPRMSDQDIMNFTDRWWRFGEIAAFEWAANKFGEGN